MTYQPDDWVDIAEGEVELFRVVVAGLHCVLGDHLGEVRVLLGGNLPEDVLRHNGSFGMGNLTFLPPSSGAMSARSGFWASGPSSDET